MITLRLLTFALVFLGAARVMAKDSVCAKGEFGEPDELKKCLADQATAEAYIQQFMTRYNMRSRGV